MADTTKDDKEKQRESGLPGGGAGRRDEDVGKSGVYPMSGPHPPGDAPIVTPGSWGQGARGAAGYEDHGESEIYMIGVKPEKCRDLMTKDPLCCLPGDSVQQVAQMMKEFDVGVVPIVEDQREKRLAGVVTDRDLAVKALAGERDPREVTIAEVMSLHVVTCSPDDDCGAALQLMEAHRVRRIPVLDASGRIVGIISQGDVAVRMREAEKTAELVMEVSQPQHV
ncbi:MAG: CBS domain-containing protein [Bryobacterales bacterium]|nr:CBS domain-containing protein [Bryobacterales bacterium]MBV9399077.1 CBS domain-containing protein [Bryobacterales bacterium]